MSGHKTRESCLDTKHVNRVWTRELCLDTKHMNRVWTLEHRNPSLVWTIEAAEHCCGQAMR